LSSVVSDYVELPRAISFLKVRASAADVKGALTQSTVGSAYQQYTGNPTSSLLGYGSELTSSYDHLVMLTKTPLRQRRITMDRPQ
jgi:hypothetical protein